MASIVNRSQSPLVRLAARYGLIGGVVVVVGITIFYYINRHPLLINILFDFRIILFGLFIFFGIKDYKDRFNNGGLRFWEGLAMGIMIYTFMTFFASIYIWLFGTYIDPGFVKQYIALSLEQFAEQQEVLIETVGEERYNTAIEALPETSALDLSFDYFLKSIPIGLFLTLIISILSRTKPKTN